MNNKAHGAKSFQALTVKANGILHVLNTDCGVCPAFDPQLVEGPHPTARRFMAIWDTGATNCVITQKVVDACGLKPTGMKEVHGVHGSQDAETFLVNIYLPNAVGFPGVEVTLGKLGGADVLIGMNIITAGDFAITNVGKHTLFSFRVPSIAAIDYVDEATRSRARGAVTVPPKFRPGPPRHKRSR